MIRDIPDWTVSDLTPTEFDACHEHLRLPPVPLVLSVPSPGRTAAERRGILAGALTGLAARGLADERGPHPDLADALALLTRFDWAADLRYWTGEYQLRVRAAVSGTRAVIAGIDRERVAVYTLPAHSAIDELLSTSGNPGSSGPRHRSVSVRTAVLDAAEGHRGITLTDRLCALGESRPVARALGELTTTVTGWGQVGVTAHRRGGRVVSFHDTPGGRVMHLRRGEHATFTPVTNPRLATAVHELVAETRDAG